MFNTPLFLLLKLLHPASWPWTKKKAVCVQRNKNRKEKPGSFSWPLCDVDPGPKKSFSWPLCALIISWLEYSHLDNIISANTTITQPSSYEQPRESCCAHVVQTPCFVVRLGLGRGTVEALIRWATGKRLTDRLPKLSLVTAHNAHVGQITIS